MAACVLADPRHNLNDLFAGMNEVRSDGTVAARQEAALLVALHNSDKPTYVASFNVAAVTAIDIFTLRHGGTNKVVRLRRISITNPGNATAAAIVDVGLGLAGGDGSGGTTPTPQAVDRVPQGNRSAGVTGGPDAAAPVTTFRTGDTVQAAGYVGLYDPLCTLSVPATPGAFTPLIFEFGKNGVKPLTISNTNGPIVMRVGAVGAGATGLRGWVEYTIEDA